MRTVNLLLLGSVLGTLGAPQLGASGEAAVIAAPAVTAPDADEPLAPGVPLEPGQLAAEWRELFERLAGQGDVRAAFTERRWFRVRKQPVVLHGTMRHSAEHGLSLQYAAPAEQVMVVDRQGLLMRDAAGRTRALAADPRAPRMDAVLLPVLRFDLAELRRYFTVSGSRRGAAWRIDLVPLSSALQRQLSTLVVHGSGDTVQRLEFQRGSNQRVVVEIERVETHVTFGAEELRRSFR